MRSTLQKKSSSTSLERYSFSFKTTRQRSFIRKRTIRDDWLRVDDKPLLRAYSIASANYEEELEFFSIKALDGALTSRLQHIEVGDEDHVNTANRYLGTGHLLPGKRLYLLSTGTGLAPFMSVIKDPDIYEQYEQVVLVYGVRYVSELIRKKSARICPTMNFSVIGSRKATLLPNSDA